MPEQNKSGIKSAAGRLFERLRRQRLSNPTAPGDEVADGRRIMVRGGVDIWFLLIVLALLCFGAVMSFSASAVYAQNKYGDSTYFLWRYILFAGIAVLGTLPFVLFARPWFWRLFGVCAYGGSVVLLLLVLVIGREGGGAQRWIDLGFMTIQPSEVAKMAVVLTMALYMSKHESQIKSDVTRESFRYGVMGPAMIFGFICMLVALEKHISGLMIIGMIGISIMFMGGTRLKYIFLIIGAIGLAGVMLILVSDYAQDRVTTWLFLEKANPLGSAWQTWQGLYAIGSGGLFGKGLGNSMQKFGYVSEPQNDFVFTIICEELGFFGALLVVSLFGLLVWRGFRIAAKAPDRFSSLAVYGLTFKVALQTILNIAVVTNSMPNTGISLPFFSSGGTSLAVQIFEMGIILSISRYSIQKR